MDFYLSVKLFFNVLVANLRDQLKPEAKYACGNISPSQEIPECVNCF